MKERIREAWESYAKDVLPPDAHPVQISETRRAFYAGAWAALQVDKGAKTLGGSLTALGAAEEECRRFKAAVLRGEA